MGSRRTQRGWAGPWAAAWAALALVACHTPPGPPEPSRAPFTGPPISIESRGTEHVLVAQLPNPGYRFTLDTVREGFKRRDVFVTIRRPNPAVLYPQVVVEQRLATTVKSQTPVAVYARVVDYNDASGEVPHAKAAQTPASAPPGP